MHDLSIEELIEQKPKYRARGPWRRPWYLPELANDHLSHLDPIEGQWTSKEEFDERQSDWNDPLKWIEHSSHIIDRSIYRFGFRCDEPHAPNFIQWHNTEGRDTPHQYKMSVHDEFEIKELKKKIDNGTELKAPEDKDLLFLQSCQWEAWKTEQKCPQSLLRLPR